MQKLYVCFVHTKAGDRLVVEGVGTSVKDGMAITPVEKNAAN